MCLGLNTMARKMMQHGYKWRMHWICSRWRSSPNGPEDSISTILKTLQHIGSFFNFTTGMFCIDKVFIWTFYAYAAHSCTRILYAFFKRSLWFVYFEWFVKILIIVKGVMGVFSDFLAERQWPKRGWCRSIEPKVTYLREIEHVAYLQNYMNKQNANKQHDSFWRS